MKNNRKILSHLILLIFSSCNELVEEEINGLNKNPVPKYQTYHLLTNQEVEEELFVDTVQEGDIIELEVS
ncbi:MAG: hypothetical protein OEY33_08060, partial [Bdellovibrionales bacterium]|nr:hypothetical protein [Bdellovibrionales bacterium]